MGFSHSFIAARGIEKPRLLEALGLGETGRSGDIEVALDGFGLGQVAGGWLIVACNDFDFSKKAPLAEISLGGEVIMAQIEEHVMCSEAAAFADGKLLWRVSHDPDRGIEDLTTEGVVPAAFAILRDEAHREQAQDDHVDFAFDVPPQLAATLCPFEFGASEGDFVELERQRKPNAAGAGGFFARMFKR